MIEERFIEAAMQESWYQRKPGTSSSYYHKAGCRILPNRLSISRDELSMVRKKGRNLLHPVIGQLIGQFTKNEESPLKANFPYVVRTQIWQIPEYPLFIGYGSIGISNEEGKIDRGSDTGDLIILESEDQDWERIQIFYFPAMVKGLEEVITFLSNKKGQLCPAPKLVENG
ncbi:MAG: hypothetical protein EOM06_13135 [Sphingobacteriia bacterium]|nr:hypothetical protein [Sphingobacteriia bacterium]